MKRTLHPAIIIILILLISPTVVLGQNTDAACRAFANRAFSDFGRNCAGLESNEVCYGYGGVNSTFNVAGVPLVPAAEYGELIEEGDRTAIVDQDNFATLENLSTIQFVAPERANEDGEWGIALADIQANLPQQLERNGARIFLFGDVTMENGVLPEEAFVLSDIVEVTVEDASIFNKPPAYQFDGYESEAIETVSGTFEADSISSDGSWVRVFFTYDRIFGERTTAWLQTSDLLDEPDLSSLPVLGPNDFASMQSFYMTAGALLPECENIVLNGVLIQGPDEVETDFLMNDVPVRITSSTFIDNPTPRSLRFTVLAGFIQINPGFDNEIVVSAGEELIVCLTEEQDLGIDQEEDDRGFDPECGIEGPFAFGTAGSSISDALLGRFRSLAGLSNNLLNYNLPTITIIRASGVGRPQISITINPPAQAQRIRDLCDQGAIRGQICDLLQ